MLLSYLDLLLQPLLLVVQFSKPVLEHLRLDLLLFHVQLLLELAGAFHAGCVVFIGLLEIVNLDVSKAEILADQLLACNLLGPTNYLTQKLRKQENG